MSKAREWIINCDYTVRRATVIVKARTSAEAQAKFDHVRGAKKRSISDMCALSYSHIY